MDEAEYTTTIQGLTISVSKDGGGTLGKSYDGTWTVTVCNGGVFMLANDEFDTGTPMTHEEVAHAAWDFAQAEIDYQCYLADMR